MGARGRVSCLRTFVVALAGLAVVVSAVPVLSAAGPPSSYSTAPAPPATAEVGSDWARPPITFEPALPAGAGATFVARGGGYRVAVGATEATWALSAPADMASGAAERPGGPSAQPPAATAITIGMALVGADPAARVVGEKALAAKVNYIVGNDPSRWRTNVPTYARVVSRGVYPGIDLAWYGKGSDLEYDFVVAPGADPDVIAMNHTGAGRSEIDAAGNLLLHTATGTLRHRRPVAYQRVGATLRPVAAAFRLDGDRVGFSVGRYDRSLPLVIDPVLVWSTYLGGTRSDVVQGIDHDADGNVYVAGRTDSPDLPVTADALDGDCGRDAVPGCSDPVLGSWFDLFVAKLSPDGDLLYSTYIGGSLQDTVSGGDQLSVTPSGEVVLTGASFSTDFPLVNAVRPCGAGTAPFSLTPSADAVLVRLNAAGDALVHSTCLGGSLLDEGYGTAVDGAGNSYVVGYTQSEDFFSFNSATMGTAPAALPVTVDPPVAPCVLHPPGFTEQLQDAFVAKFDPTGVPMYSSCWGGSGYETAMAVDADSRGNAYVVGFTDSGNFPQRNNAGVQTGRGFPADNRFAVRYDGFVLKVTQDALGLPTPALSTYFGGERDDFLTAVAATDAGLYVGGSAKSRDFDTKWAGATAGAYQAEKVLNATFVTEDAFLARLGGVEASPVVERLTHLGGTYNDSVLGIAVDERGIWVTGRTESASDEPGAVPFPRVHPLQDTCAIDHPEPNPYRGEQYADDRPVPDAFLARLDKDLTTLPFSTCLGGTGYDQAANVVVNADGNVYVAGRTLSPNDDPYTTEVEIPFPTTEGARDRTCGADGLCKHVDEDFETPRHGDGFVLRLSADADTTPPTISCAGPDGAWHADNVVLACTATDAGSKLANPADANFGLSTSVAAGSESAGAATGTRAVCDVVGNCATAGPIGGNKVDRKAPSANVSVPVAGAAYVVGQAVATSYGCGDGGSGVASCSGPASLDTASVGVKSFAVHAVDAVGNAATATRPYSVTYGICLLYDPTKGQQSGATIAIRVRVCDAAGTNLSSASTVLTATGVTPPGTLRSPGNANPNGVFNWDADSQSYVYTLTTKGFPAGDYALLFNASADPVGHRAPFRVK